MPGRIFALSLMAAFLVNTATAQQAQKPPLPPSSLEQRLQEYQAQREAARALREQQAKSRLRRLTGAGQAAGARAVEGGAGGIISSSTAVHLAIAAALAYTALKAYTDTEEFRSSGGGGGGATSSN